MTGRLSRSRYLAGIQCPKRLHLEIQEGIIAGLQYYRMNFEVRDEGGGARLRNALLKYCERDRVAMVELRKALLSRARA